MSKILSEIHPENPIGVISGPNLAEEIASSQLSGTVIASTYKNLRKDMVDILSSDFLEFMKIQIHMELKWAEL